MTPKLRKADKVLAPYPLNKFPEELVVSVAKDLILARYIQGTDVFEGSSWEHSFARAIGATWKPSNVGLDDIVLGNCCWGAKTVKSARPKTQPSVRLISGRNSLDYSYETSDVRSMPPGEVGKLVLDIWNARVSQIRQKFQHARTVVLLKGPKLLSGAIFEFELLRVEIELVTWSWNNQRNLEGHVDGQHRFTWQPHGAQFTMIEPITDRVSFSIQLPQNIAPYNAETLLKEIGYSKSWIKVEAK